MGILGEKKGFGVKMGDFGGKVGIFGENGAFGTEMGDLRIEGQSLGPS